MKNMDKEKAKKVAYTIMQMIIASSQADFKNTLGEYKEAREYAKEGDRLTAELADLLSTPNEQIK